VCNTKLHCLPVCKDEMWLGSIRVYILITYRYFVLNSSYVPRAVDFKIMAF
jgi:hypothetical protein